MSVHWYARAPIMDAREVRRQEELARSPSRILGAAEAARRIAAGSPPSDAVISAARAAAVPWEAAFRVEVGARGALECFAVVRAARGEARELVALPCGDREWLAAFAALGLTLEDES